MIKLMFVLGKVKLSKDYFCLVEGPTGLDPPAGARIGGKKRLLFPINKNQGKVRYQQHFALGATDSY